MNEQRRPLFEHGHKKRPVGYWVVALLIVVGAIFLLPRLIEILGV